VTAAPSVVTFGRVAKRYGPTPALRGLSPIDPFDVRRLATDRSISDAMFLTQMALPQLAYRS